jgi:hypothetical protein
VTECERNAKSSYRGMCPRPSREGAGQYEVTKDGSTTARKREKGARMRQAHEQSHKVTPHTISSDIQHIQPMTRFVPPVHSRYVSDRDTSRHVVQQVRVAASDSHHAKRLQYSTNRLMSGVTM